MDGKRSGVSSLYSNGDKYMVAKRGRMNGYGCRLVSVTLIVENGNDQMHGEDKNLCRWQFFERKISSWNSMVSVSNVSGRKCIVECSRATDGYGVGTSGWQLLSWWLE